MVKFYTFQGYESERNSSNFLFNINIYYVMRQVIGDNDYNLGFKITDRRFRKEPSIDITYLSYTDDIVLISDIKLVY